MNHGKNARLMLPYTADRSPIFTVPGSWGPEIRCLSGNTDSDIQIFQLPLLLCDSQCMDSMTPGAESSVTPAPFHAGRLSLVRHEKIRPLWMQIAGSPCSISQFMGNGSVLYMKLSG